MHTQRIILCGLLALPSGLEGQALAQRVAAAGDGAVRVSFAARRGVCGNGGHNITIVSDDESEEVEGDCDPGPVRVSLRVHGGRVTEAHTYVGGRWRAPKGPATDLGTVSAAQAAKDLLTLAERAEGDADELVTAAALADSAVVWPGLLRMARRTDLPVETRRQAVFWLGQAAGEAAARGLDSLTADQRGDIEVRKQAVFALSQRPADEGVPALIRVARTNPNGELRKTALFWLGQSEDPRALAVFEDILK
jgi:HEAT repeat protein